MKAFWEKVKTFFGKVARKMAEFFENENGGFSSRRLGGIGMIAVSAVLAFRGADPTIVLAYLGAGSTLIGITTADNRLPQ